MSTAPGQARLAVDIGGTFTDVALEAGARLVTTAAYQLERSNGTYALCTMCIGVGQGIAMIIKSA